ncbi:MAG: hypothetical protein LH650_06925 [Chloroflexi bacterium]|nr:hypothetical protein [Chloroflexota bacterium]
MAVDRTTQPVDVAIVERGRLRSLVGADMAVADHLHADDFQVLMLWSWATQVDG